jgi:hypothetical protein
MQTMGSCSTLLELISGKLSCSQIFFAIKVPFLEQFGAEIDVERDYSQGPDFGHFLPRGFSNLKT